MVYYTDTRIEYRSGHVAAAGFWLRVRESHTDTLSASVAGRPCCGYDDDALRC